ncbi:hypothetical protein BDAP_002516 [Binucleata daphniae]
MKTRNVYKKAEITSKCCVIGTSIYYIHYKNLYCYDFIANTNKKLRILDCNLIQSTKTDILTVYNNKINVYNTTGDTLNSLDINFIPISLKKYNNNIYILGHKNLIVYTNNTFEEIRIVQKETLIDFCKAERKFIFLTNSNKIYECEDFTKTNRIMLNKQIHFFDSTQTIKNIGYFDNKYFLCFEYKIAVCKKINNNLYVYYTFENENSKIVPFFDTKIYVKAKGLFLLNEYPEKITNEDIIHLCEEIAICEDKLVIIEEENLANSLCKKGAISMKQNKHNDLLRESDVDARVDALFELYRYNDTGSHKFEDALLLKKEIHEYKAKYLDKLKMIYTELKVTNESFVEYAKELEKESKKIEKQMNELKKRRESVANNLLQICERIRSIKENQKHTGEYDKTMKRIKDLKMNVMKMKTIESKYILDKLKCQNVILKSYTNE